MFHVRNNVITYNNVNNVIIKALGGTTVPITSSEGRSEAPKALSESYHSLPQENPTAVRGF